MHIILKNYIHTGPFALEKIQEFESTDTSREAMALLATIIKDDFVVTKCTLLILSKLFGLGESVVCRQLQRANINFSEVINVAHDLVNKLSLNQTAPNHSYVDRCNV